MKIYTDYPFEELGDEPNSEAPIREVEMEAYDGDKYVRVNYDGKQLEVKAGYLYTKAGRLGEVPALGDKIKAWERKDFYV